jgi:hypothetical protein
MAVVETNGLAMCAPGCLPGRTPGARPRPAFVRRDWAMEPAMRIRHYTDLYGNSCARTMLPAGRSILRFDALVLVPDATEGSDEQVLSARHGRAACSTQSPSPPPASGLPHRQDVIGNLIIGSRMPLVPDRVEIGQRPAGGS